MSKTEEEKETKRSSPPSFYKIYGRDLSVAIRVIFPGDAVIKAKEGHLHFPGLINPSPEIHLKKEERRLVDLPADPATNQTKEDNFSYQFEPWFDAAEAKSFHVVFRLRPKERGGSQFRWIRFGRPGEETDFGFSPSSKKYFINLALEVFQPLFVKIQRSGEFDYLKVRLEPDLQKENPIARIWGGRPVVLKIQRIKPSAAPPHLAKALP